MSTPSRLRRYLPPGTELTDEQAAVASAILALDQIIARSGAKWGKSFVRLVLARYFADEGGARDLTALDAVDRARVDESAAVSLRVLAGVYEEMIAIDRAYGRTTIADRVLTPDDCQTIRARRSELGHA